MQSHPPLLLKAESGVLGIHVSLKAEKEGILNTLFTLMFLLHIKGTAHNMQTLLVLLFKFPSLKENKFIGYRKLKKTPQAQPGQGGYVVEC